ncbi:MAG: DUF2065 domain-containing protein [Candidatus Competibacteraceae bacterium]
MWQDVLAAVGLMLVFEGIMPFLNPQGVKETLLQILQLEERILRLLGLGSMLIGLLLLYLIRG